MLSLVEARIFQHFYRPSLRAQRGNREYLSSRHAVFAIATSEDLLAMTDMKRF